MRIDVCLDGKWIDLEDTINEMLYNELLAGFKIPHDLKMGILTLMLQIYNLIENIQQPLDQFEITFLLQIVACMLQQASIYQGRPLKPIKTKQYIEQRSLSDLAWRKFKLT